MTFAEARWEVRHDVIGTRSIITALIDMVALD
jgi:hypothetical protein